MVIILVVVALLAILVGIPVLMVLLIGRETFRDVVIIAWGVLTILAFVLFIAWILVLWGGINGLIRDVKVIVNEDVRPLLGTTRETANNVTGTARFASDTVASPIIRVYGIVSGVRRGIGVFTGLTRRERDKDEGKRRR